ncbi:MAG: MFS transporter [Firmicutes bacterium]|nr:MFS transporter [Bacillota bacterium]
MEQERLSGPQARRALKMSIWDGFFASVSDNFLGPFVALYGSALGANNSQIGLITALPNLSANILQVPGAALAERLGRRKRLVILGSFWLRFIWIPAAFVPLFYTGYRAVYVFIALLTLRGIFASLTVPAWTSLMADITPYRIRGSFFAIRNIVINVAAFVVPILAGYLIKGLAFPAGYQIGAVGAFLAGLVSLYFFALIPEPPMVHVGPESGVTGAQNSSGFKPGLKGLAEMFRANRKFAAFNNSSMLWNFAVYVPAGLFPVFFVKTLGGSESQWGIMTALVSLTTMIGQRYWGTLADRFGNRNIMVLTGVVNALLPLMWALIGAPGYVAVIQLLAGFGWAGYNLANFNLLLEVTPDQGRTHFVGVYNTLNGLAQSVGPLVGGVLADLAGIRFVLVLSLILRMMAWYMFKRTVEDRAARRISPADLIPAVRRGGRP